MSDCKQYRSQLVALLCGELAEAEKKRVRNHLESCSLCRTELAETKMFTEHADSYQEELAAAMDGVDWESSTARITEAVFGKKEPAPGKSAWERFWMTLLRPGLRPVYAGLLAGILIGSLVTYFILRPSPPRLGRSSEFNVTPDFLERVDLEMARRETLDYLDKSQYLLLDFVQSSAERPALWQTEYGARQAKELLSRKKYINPQLDKFRMAKAKAICDQIELLFYELAHLSEGMAPEELERLQSLIEERQLLLKIKLVKKELEKNAI